MNSVHQVGISEAIAMMYGGQLSRLSIRPLIQAAVATNLYPLFMLRACWIMEWSFIVFEIEIVLGIENVEGNRILTPKPALIDSSLSM